MKIGDVRVLCGGLSLAAVLAGCSAGSASPATGPNGSATAGPAGSTAAGPDASSAAGLQVSSGAFSEGAAIPKKYACARQGGGDVSPPLAWSGVPGSARELAIVVDDSDAPGGSYIHWIVTRVPISARSTSEGEAPGNVAPGSGGKAAYAGPCPPGGVHHYHFIVYALPGPVTPSGDAKAVHQQLKDAAVTSGETVGTWGS